ncbi:hypothetical protein [Mucilaginibacter flavus]|uniref:hypothetical protein n=1 Tax=Mucilaginibacter flavus TaxID=931504 RepID=UPI0025B31182|nr:hypothetical protein [Mucilaginibacter flavus]MDN3583961.1 hypothetical protein [Mucilaginibacter flavus]
MKPLSTLRLIVLMTGLMFLHQSGFAQESGFQRLAFNAVDLALGAGEASAPISSFCYDHAREAPETLTGYKSVHLDGHSSVTVGNFAPMTLQEALDKGYIELTGNDYDRFNFVNKSGLPVKIKTTGPSMVGDVAGDSKGASSALISNALKGNREQFDLQEQLWHRRKQQEVYMTDGLLQPGFSEADFLRADQSFRARHHVQSEAGLERALLQRVKQQREKSVKLDIYQHLDLLAGPNPTASQLLKADADFRRLRSIRPGVDMSFELEEEARDLANERKVIKDQYGLDESADRAAIRQAEQDYKTKHGSKTPTDFKNSIEADAANISATKEYALRALYRLGAEPRAEVIKQLQHAGGFPETGSLDHSPVTHLLSTYESTLNPLLGEHPHATAQEYIRLVSAIRQDLHLSPGFGINAADQPYLDKLSKRIMEVNDYSYIRDSRVVGGQLILLSPEKATILQLGDLSLAREVPIRGYATIHKLSPDLFIVNSKLVPVSGLNKAVENLPDLQKENCVFGESLTTEDCQSIVRTHQIKRLVMQETRQPAIRFTSNNCEFPLQPEFKEEDFYEDWDLQFPIHKLGSPTVGSGINGELTVEVDGTLKSRLEKVKTIIRNVMKELRGHPEEDLATELRKELKDNDIPVRMVRITVSGLDISKNNRPNGYKKNQYDAFESPIHHPAGRLRGRLQLSAERSGFPALAA